MKSKASKELIALREGRITVDEFRRFVELRAILEGNPDYLEFKQLAIKILKK